MAKDIDSLLQDIVNRSYQQKVIDAKAALSECFGILMRKGVDKQKATVVVVTFLAAAVAADGKFSQPERSLLVDIFGDDLESLVKSINKKSFDLMDQFVDTLNPIEKNMFCLLAAYVAAVDDTINRDELKYLKKLLAE